MAKTKPTPRFTALHVPTPWQATRTFLSSLRLWGSNWWSRLPEWKQVLLFIFLAINVLLTLAVGIDHATLGRDERPNRWPWQVYSSWAGSAYSSAKAVACWPIRAAVTCCVPGYATSPSVATEGAKFYRLSKCEGDGKGWRGVVIGKDLESPRTTVSPKIEWNYDGVCGRDRWRSFVDYGISGVEVIVSPRTTVYTVQLQGGTYSNVYVTKATWDRVQAGDILAGCNAYEDGVDTKDHDALRTDAQFELNWENGDWRDIKGIDTIYPAAVKTLLQRLNAADLKECQEVRAAERKLALERKQHPERFYESGYRRSDDE